MEGSDHHYGDWERGYMKINQLILYNIGVGKLGLNPGPSEYHSKIY